MNKTVSRTVDCISENCPMPLIKTRAAILDAEKGDVIKVIGTHP
ncbi:MAG: sulfurtransferase TusA family protein, partial [Spirochaetes bacterium]|nr:sulfurtransferase TusA family protein [Spirochaetota bacterium]